MQYQFLDDFEKIYHPPEHERRNYFRLIQERFEVHKHGSNNSKYFVFLTSLYKPHCTSIPTKITDFVFFSFNISATLGTYILNLVFSTQIAASEISNSETVFPNAFFVLF